MGTIKVDQGGDPWLFNATGGSGTLPIQITTQMDLIPKRIRWEPDSTTVAGHAVVITDQQGRQVFKEVAVGAYFEPVEHRPRTHEKWMGYYNAISTPNPTNVGIQLTQLDSGQLMIYF